MLSDGKSHGTSGFFWLNVAKMQIDVLGLGWNAESSTMLPFDQKTIDTLWMSEVGFVNAFFFGPKPKDVVKQYASVTETSTTPQLFATCYHQCRWNYRDEVNVKNVDSKLMNMISHMMFYVLILSILMVKSTSHGIGSFFPNPEEMQKDFSSGRRMVSIVDPHIKRDDGYHIHKEASKIGYYVKVLAERIMMVGVGLDRLLI